MTDGRRLQVQARITLKECSSKLLYLGFPSRELSKSRRDLDEVVSQVLVSRGHPIGLDQAVLQVGVVLDQELPLSLEELVNVLEGVAQQQLVAGLLEGAEKSDQLLLLVLAAHVQVLVVLEEDGQVGVVPGKQCCLSH